MIGRLLSGIMGVAGGLLLTGCSALQSAFEPPSLAVPEYWTQGPAEPDATVRLEHWWRGFDEPLLNEWVEQALRHNHDLASAALLVRRARLQVGLAGTRSHVELSASTSSTRTLDGNAASQSRQSLGLGVSYELDVWRRLDSLHNAAQWLARATAEDRDSLAMTLVAATVRGYWLLANRQQRLVLSEQALAHATQVLALVRVQHRAGAVSSLEVFQAQRARGAQVSAQAQAQQALVQARGALAPLFGGAPPTRGEPLAPLGAVLLPEIPAGLPAQLLERRPDLQALQLRLRAMLANHDALRTGYYPGLSLTGALGSSSTALRDLLERPVATLGSALILPFVQWRERGLNIRVAEIDYERARLEFRQAFYRALQEVESSLSARTQLLARQVSLRESQQAAARIARVYQQRYLAGAVPLMDWLEAQQSLRDADLALADNALELLNAYVELHVALGGGPPRAAEPE